MWKIILKLISRFQSKRQGKMANRMKQAIKFSSFVRWLFLLNESLWAVFHHFQSSSFDYNIFALLLWESVKRKGTESEREREREEGDLMSLKYIIDFLFGIDYLGISHYLLLRKLNEIKQQQHVPSNVVTIAHYFCLQ